MAKQRIEEAPSPQLPAATLFLDDIEEIARIFQQAQLKLAGDVPNRGELAQLTYQIDDWICDSIDDVKELGRYKTLFELRLQSQYLNCCFYHTVGSRNFASWLTGAPSDVEWAVHGRVLEVVKRRSGWWYPWRRPRFIFQKSFEYKSLPSVLKRHGSQIVIAVVTAVATLLGTEGVKWLWRYFHK